MKRVVAQRALKTACIGWFAHQNYPEDTRAAFAHAIEAFTAGIQAKGLGRASESSGHLSLASSLFGSRFPDWARLSAFLSLTADRIQSRGSGGRVVLEGELAELWGDVGTDPASDDPWLACDLRSLRLAATLELAFAIELDVLAGGSELDFTTARRGREDLAGVLLTALRSLPPDLATAGDASLPNIIDPMKCLLRQRAELHDVLRLLRRLLSEEQDVQHSPRKLIELADGGMEMWRRVNDIAWEGMGSSAVTWLHESVPREHQVYCRALCRVAVFVLGAADPNLDSKAIVVGLENVLADARFVRSGLSGNSPWVERLQRAGGVTEWLSRFDVRIQDITSVSLSFPRYLDLVDRAHRQRVSRQRAGQRAKAARAAEDDARELQHRNFTTLHNQAAYSAQQPSWVWLHALQSGSLVGGAVAVVAAASAMELIYSENTPELGDHFRQSGLTMGAGTILRHLRDQNMIRWDPAHDDAVAFRNEIVHRAAWHDVIGVRGPRAIESFRAIIEACHQPIDITEIPVHCEDLFRAATDAYVGDRGRTVAIDAATARVVGRLRKSASRWYCRGSVAYVAKSAGVPGVNDRFTDFVVEFLRSGDEDEFLPWGGVDVRRTTGGLTLRWCDMEWCLPPLSPANITSSDYLRGLFVRS